MRPATVIVPGKLIAGRHPCAWGSENAPAEIDRIAGAGATLFLDLTVEGELDPYVHLVPSHARHRRMPIVDFSIPTHEQLVEMLDVIDGEIDGGGLVFVHCWAGCGRTGLVVGSWLVRHGTPPKQALEQVAETRGVGCPQTLEQRLLVLGWHEGL